MERPNTLQLGGVATGADHQSFRVNHELASKIIRPLFGRFYAVEFPAVDRIGSIWLSDDASSSLSSDFCVVIAVGKGVGLSPGDVVAVRPTHGDWIEDAVFGPYVAEGRVRVYGVACQYQGDPVRVEWDECAPVRLVDLHKEDSSPCNASRHSLFRPYPSVAAPSMASLCFP